MVAGCWTGGGGHQAGRSECGGDEEHAGPGREARLPGRGQQDDEAHHQLTLPQQGDLPQVRYRCTSI